MEFLNEPDYYVALLSAAERYGAGHQRPQSLQVMVPKNRRPVECGSVRIQFIARQNIRDIPVETFNTQYGYIRYSSAEMTALELVGYPQHAGGLSNVATVVGELAEELDGEKLSLAADICPVSWSQRLGYLLDLVDSKDVAASLEGLVLKKASRYIPLRRSQDIKGAAYNSKWKVIVNVDVEPDE